MNATPSTRNRGERTPPDPIATGLRALVWILADGARGERLLAVTGLVPEELRVRATDPALLAAVLSFLEAHEPDLIACAKALALAPEALIAAKMGLER